MNFNRGFMHLVGLSEISSKTQTKFNLKQQELTSYFRSSVRVYLNLFGKSLKSAQARKVEKTRVNQRQESTERYFENEINVNNLQQNSGGCEETQNISRNEFDSYWRVRSS